jgi:hypothetical protein
VWYQEISWQDFWRSHAPRGAKAQPAKSRKNIGFTEKPISSAPFAQIKTKMVPLEAQGRAASNSSFIFLISYYFGPLLSRG